MKDTCKQVILDLRKAQEELNTIENYGFSACCVRTIQQPLPVWIIVTSLPTHISINSHPFLVGIVSGIIFF